MDIPKLYELYKTHYLVTTDTRAISQNSLFFALKGENFNGNNFAEKALALGARFAIIDEETYQTDERMILVTDVLQTLQKLANYHRKQLQLPIIGLTGSNGKTTSKELIHGVLQQKFKTVATKGNLNNHIGVPLTLLSMTPDTELGIVEMGANHQQEIAFLSSICEPDFGYITNFGKAHLEGFGGVEGVIKGKSELYDFIRANHKMVFVNPADPIQMTKTSDISRVLFDLERIQYVGVNPFIQLSLDGQNIQTQLMGNYNFPNIAAAITMGLHFGVPTDAISKAIEGYVPQNNRSQIVKTAHNTLFLDAYNANPSSMKVALENFAALSATHKTVILGDMFELGEDSAHEHQAIADLAASLHFETIFLVGKNFHGVSTSHLSFEDFESLKIHLSKHPFQNKTILIKGSRGMRLERLVELL
ncbi:UDP-N-acetylmuramoyl-tripeptide--D-alanyl-D-alanine ligase [Polaribacter gangjinensis]|uniref:UDP-N-acetylmuramoyl-tripeptide--D-alanyl-D-alanine ligase n=1 Tax=Polaribacter gangjinensis TaxID=574710 RepID=A0A2S7W864_9FLAO|nr:UDP-N-acetylmuramoyl-tripeptide--D-alanyl-D-alanine ligase [Polaribacter gangjinensis]PQJ73820.1 UDP-N-acetylmuramoyl-tripeptide--D-alanyl-D-alanine ligase [Polaribacter gangjinensis]